MKKNKFKIIDLYTLVLLGGSLLTMLLSVEIGGIFLTLSVLSLSLKKYLEYKYGDKMREIKEGKYEEFLVLL